MTRLFSSETCKLLLPFGRFFEDSPADIEVVRFVFEMTKNQWLYIYHVVSMRLMFTDRLLSCFLFTKTYSSPQGGLCLGIYIISRLISFIDYVVLCCNRKRLKCYAVRTVLPIILSAICNFASVVPNILEFRNNIGVMYPVSIALGLCLLYVFSLMSVFFEIRFADRDVVEFQTAGSHWLQRFHAMRRFLTYFDRIFDLLALALFTAYYRDSLPDRHICLGIYVTLRVISLALCYFTKLFKCYPIRTVLPAVVSLFCVPVLLVPDILNPKFSFARTVVLITRFSIVYIGTIVGISRLKS